MIVNNIDFSIMSNKEDVKIEDITEKVNEINKNIQKITNIPKNNDNKQIIEDMNEKLVEINAPTINMEKKKKIINKNKLFEKIGILDPKGEEINPLTGEPYKNIYTDNKKGLTYEGYGKIWSSLPTYEHREEILEKMHDNQCLLITAGTGSGKTVLIPKFLLHVLNYNGKIAITIPRVSATKSTASFSAMTLDVKLGEEVGYMVKGDKRTTRDTSLVYATDGYILAKMQGGDPYLEEFDALIIDEAHERNINIDLILFLVKNILVKRPEFKFIIMSATIDPKIFMDYYKKFGIKHIELAGKPNFPVKEIFLKKEVNVLAPNGEVTNTDYLPKSVEVMFDEIIYPGKEGDILALYPSKSDCDKACQLLSEMVKKRGKDKNSNPFCISLTSTSKEKPFRNATEENYALGKNKSYKNLDEKFTRRVVMATEVAESSLTFGGDPIDWVIDTGLSNTNKYYPETEIEALEKRYISKASHKQRMGRTGRLRPGTCYNIFTEKEYKKFLEYPVPPIMQSDLTENILSFMNLPVITHAQLPFKYPAKISNKSEISDNETLNTFLAKMIALPKVEYVQNALKKLLVIDAVHAEGRKVFINPIGKAVHNFRDADPFKAMCIIESYNYKCSTEVIDLMALLTILDDSFDKILIPFRSKTKNAKELKAEKNNYDKKIKSLFSSYGDHITLSNIIQKYKEKKYTIKRERGRQVLIPKETTAASEWAKSHFVSGKKLKLALRLSKDLNREFGKMIGNYRREYPEMSNKKYVYRNSEVDLHSKLEDNIMQCLVKGYMNNIVRKVGRGRSFKYKNCFPDIPSFADVDRFSSINKLKVKPMTGVYSVFISIFGRKRFQTFSKVPVKVIDAVKQAKRELVKECGKK